MPTMGLLRRIDPVEPKNAASPKAKMPPSEATSQYPLPGLLPGGAATPVPDRLEDGRVTPLATTVRLEDRGPMVVGLKETDTVQLPASGTVAPVQVSLPMMKCGGLGWPSVTEFTVTGAPVTVNSVTLGQPNPPHFIIGSDTCTGATVPDAGSCTVSVSFNPTTIGPRSSNLTVVANGVTLPSSSLSGTGVAAPPGSNPGKGYWEVASDGGIFNFGSAKFLGSTGSIKLNKPIVGMASTPDGQGYWLVASDGGIFAFGDAAFFGSTGSIRLNKPIVGMVAAPDGAGYWMVATDGGIFAFGSARFFGSTGSIRLNKPIVGMATTPDGGGYWMAATDGGIFAFGDAAFFGSTGSIRLNQPVVGIAGTLDGAGYWMAASDGGIFNFGDAGFFGSTGSIKLNKPMVGLAAAP